MEFRGRVVRSAGPRRAPRDASEFAPPSRFTLFLRRAFVRLSKPPLSRLGLVLLLALFVGTGAYGAVRGGHMEAWTAAAREAGDAVARGFGFGIVQIEISGNRYLSREELLARAGITEQTSLLLLNAEGVRATLKEDARVADATVRKLYPDRLEIAIEEREGFARWQRGGKLHLIARDGTVLESDIRSRHIDLPLVVGAGAAPKAAAFLDLIARFPAVREEVRAGVFVAERRWNLRLKNGIDVRLPEEDPALALERLVQLDRSRQLMSRDLAVIDLRVPEQVSVGLSDEAAAALKQKTPKRRGADS
ncbi:MAG: FtsQ-type POTRA domain-containing protein [Bradyrhizobiaceae bacterium]|nr:FtsQ-type POTRA domain-containing protein [Bradyrhizobiaceae bacterium]